MRLDRNEITLDIKVGKNSPKKSHKLAKLNSLAFGDVITLGCAKFKKLNLVDTRLAENERKKREQMLAIEHLESITGNASDDKDDLTERGFAKFNF